MALPRLYLPISRYAFPAIIPTVILLCMGWVEIVRWSFQRFQLSPWAKYLVAGLVFVLLDVYALVSIISFYRS
jgi:hypothetical protein